MVAVMVCEDGCFISAYGNNSNNDSNSDSNITFPITRLVHGLHEYSPGRQGGTQQRGTVTPSQRRRDVDTTTHTEQHDRVFGVYRMDGL